VTDILQYVAQRLTLLKTEHGFTSSKRFTASELNVNFPPEPCWLLAVRGAWVVPKPCKQASIGVCT
jgi:hypothetical protein